MLISWDHKFLFIHNPKTAGTSLTRALTPYARDEDRRAYRLQALPITRNIITTFLGGNAYTERTTGFNPHARLAEFEARFGRDKADELTKIIFVRNPFAHAVSLYNHVVRTNAHPDHERYRMLGMEDTLRSMIDDKRPTQSAYVTYKGDKTISADFVGHMETAEKDAAKLFASLKLPITKALPRINTGGEPTTDFAKIFNRIGSDFTDYFRRDFENFNYSTDPAKAIEPPSLNTGDTK